MASSFTYFYVSVVLILTYLSCASSLNVAVVGGGIGGSSASYYIKKYFCCGHKITLFDKNSYVGGRTLHLSIYDPPSSEENATVVNLGADAWAIVNKYLVELQKELQFPLDESTDDGNGELGFFDGKQLLEPYSNLGDAIKLGVMLEASKLSLSLNYDERGSKSFSTISEFVGYGKLNYYTESSAESLFAEKGISEKFTNSTVLPITRVIYDQPLNITAFATMVSLISGSSESFSALGGNDQIAKVLVKNSVDQLNLNSAVSDITKNSDNTYTLSYDTLKGAKGEKFDKVVLAAPFEFLNISFHGVKLPPIQDRDFQHWYVTMVVASGLSPTYFGLTEGKEVPDDILTYGNSTAPFVTISFQAHTSAGNKVYKIFSNVDVSADLEQIFLDKKNHYVHYWPYTFPILAPVKPATDNNNLSYQPIVLDSNLYYINTMESVASAMEGSVIGARNVALLMSKQNTQ